LIAHEMAPVRLVTGDYVLTPEMNENLSRATERSARKRLERLLQAARAARARASGVLLTGVAHEQILRAARRRHAEMIVGYPWPDGARQGAARQRGHSRGDPRDVSRDDRPRAVARAQFRASAPSAMGGA
jgi:hypothetical protein